MSHVAIGKLLPNLKVTVDETSKNDDEMKSEELILDYDEEERDVEVMRAWMATLQNPKVYKNRRGAFTTGLDLISEKNAEKLDKRAERFGIERENSSISENVLSLYKSMDVDIENRNSAKMKNTRLDALHMRGVNELNTVDIFQYFQDYGPSTVEWINDFSCNVVWLDEITCARALLGMSKPLSASSTKKETPSLDHEQKDELLVTSASEETQKEEGELMDTEEESSEPSLFLDIPVPPGLWRVGNPHPKAKSILLRFASKDDKKLPGAEKRSSFYQKYGNPNYGGLTGLISSSRKRKMLAATNRKVIESSKPISKEEDSKVSEDVPSQKSRMPRMRMYADDEELKQIKSRLSNKDDKPHRPRVHSRLGVKYTQDDLCQLGMVHSRLGSRHSQDDNYPLGMVHSRLGARHTQEDLCPIEPDLSLHKRQGLDVGDLRKKIKKLRTESDVSKHRSPLCIDD